MEMHTSLGAEETKIVLVGAEETKTLNLTKQRKYDERKTCKKCKLIVNCIDVNVLWYKEDDLAESFYCYVCNS